MTTTWWSLLPSPIDDLLLTTDGHALTRVYFSPQTGIQNREGWYHDETHPVLEQAGNQLSEYFAGERQVFDLPLAPTGTAFQQRVWIALRRIPHGETRSYRDIAAELGLSPAASRAVGLANGANPLPIVVPCHRVIGANGALTGFGGGLERKRFLLDLESQLLF